MRLSQFLNVTLFLTLGFALASPAARGQSRLDDIKLSSKLDIDINEMKKGDVKPNRKTLDEFMSYFAQKLQHPDMFKPAQEFGTTILPMQSTLDQFSARVLVPEPGQRYNIYQADYIKWFGDAFVATFKPILETHADRIVRLNAARMLAAGAACGAPAFGPLVTELITNPNTPAEVKFWAFKAAEGLLAAHDIQKMVGNNPRGHTLDTVELGALVKALEENIFDPTKFVTFPTGVDPKKPPAELGAVVSFIRRQVVRAYARIRFASLETGDGKSLYPAFTLARVAMSDPKIVPAPGPVELAEAVLGLTAMQPGNDMMIDAAADAVATGLISLASVLNNPNADAAVKTTPWKVYGARLRVALPAWKTLIANSAVPPNRQPQAATQVVDAAMDAIVIPLEQGGAAGKVNLNIQKVTTARQSVRGASGYSKLLLRNDPATSIAGFQN